MATRKSVTVCDLFFSSPGGLEEERRAFRDTVHELTASAGPTRRLAFLPSGCEHVSPGVGRPQDRINGLLVDVDVLLLVLHDRWGSQTGIQGYSSGTIEEFAVAMELIADAAKPMREIVVLFKEVPRRQLEDPGKQLRPVLDFRKALDESRELQYGTFGAIEEFNNQIRHLLQELMSRYEAGWQKQPMALPQLQQWVETQHERPEQPAVLDAPSFPPEVVESLTKASLPIEPERRTTKLEPEPTAQEPNSRWVEWLAWRPSGLGWRPAISVAASLALVVVGLRVHDDVPGARPQQVAEVQISVPIIEMLPSGELTRGLGPVPVYSAPSSAPELVLEPVILEVEEFPSYRVEVRAGDNVAVTQSGLSRAALDDLNVKLKRSLLPAGSFEVLIFGCDGEHDEEELLRYAGIIEYDSAGTAATSRAVGSQVLDAEALVRLGSANRRLGRFDEARVAYESALRQATTPGDTAGEADVRLLLADLELVSGRPRQALAYASRALELSHSTANEQTEVAALHAVGSCFETLGRLEEARDFLEQSVQRIEALASSRPSVLRSRWSASRGSVHEELVDVLMALQARDPDHSYGEAAFAVSESRRLAEFRDLGLTEPGDSATSEVSGFRNTVPLKVPAIQSEVLDAGSLLLHYMLGEDRSYLWTLTRTSFNSYVLPPRYQIEAAAEQAHRALAESRTRKNRVRVEPWLQRLGDMLVRPAATEVVAATRLLISAEGALRTIPFAALESPGADLDQPLRVDIVRIPSASVLAQLRQRSASVRAVEPKVAIVADPVFSADDPRLRRPGKEARWIPGAKQTPIALDRLDGTRLEAERIAALIKPERRFEAYGFEASRETLLAGELRDHQIIHIATHGVVSSPQGGVGLVLSRYGEDGRPQDGTLRAAEIANLDLPADLVVLSACNTALGEGTRGEGIMGLTRGFLHAGSSRVLVSLWDIDDQATAALMERFYENLLVEHQPPAKALRQAQLSIKNEERWQAPYYWAGFVMQGDSG